MFNGSSLLISGSSGTFGNAIIPYLLREYSLERIVVFSRDELKQSEMRERYSDDRLRFFLGDIRDRDRLRIALRGIDLVIHAAALKQIPAGEYDPYEFIKTNIIGTQNVLMEAQDANVKKCLVISSDKAAAPLTLYGSTKNIAEHLARTAGHYAPNGCKFAAVRYGNVAGSRGSIIPVWKEMIKQGREYLPVTHPKMSRFFFRKDDAIKFAIWAMENMQGGELFVPKMPSFLIVDLAKAMERPYRFVGIRGAEKIAEVMVTAEEARYFRGWEGRYVRFPEGQEKGTELEEDYEYRSDTNPEWLSPAQLKDMINDD